MGWTGWLHSQSWPSTGARWARWAFSSKTSTPAMLAKVAYLVIPKGYGSIRVPSCLCTMKIMWNIVTQVWTGQGSWWYVPRDNTRFWHFVKFICCFFREARTGTRANMWHTRKIKWHTFSNGVKGVQFICAYHLFQMVLTYLAKSISEIWRVCK